MTIYPSSPSGFYVYAHLRKDGTPYYIGKGSGKRAWKRTKQEFKAPKNWDRVKIIESNLTEEQAFELEKSYIQQYGRKDLGTGTLRNKTDGGEGTSGYKHSEEDIDIWRNALSHEYLVMFPDGTIDKIKNLNQFCREHNLDTSNAHATVIGNQRHHKGYTLIKYDDSISLNENEVKLKESRNRETRNPSKSYLIQTPTGSIIEITNLKKFALDNNLSRSCLQSTLNGNSKQHKGFKVIQRL